MWREAITALYFAAIALTWNSLSYFQITISAIALIIVLLGKHNLWLIVYTSPRDLRALSRYLSLRYKIYRIKRRDVGIPQLFQENVRKHPNKIAFYFEEERWTFQQVEDYSNRVANYFKTQGIKHGDCIALFMENRVEYVCIWLGLCKLGAVPALVNTNLKLGTLSHCISIVGSKIVITGAEGQEAFQDIRDELNDIPVYVSGPPSKEISYKGGIDLDKAIEQSSVSSPPEIDQVKFADKMVYIYTSGTTGLPKAAVIKHSRALFAECGMFSLVGISHTDIIYDPLPLYHTVGGIVGLGMCLVEGCTMAIRRKFSASNYWKDCAKYNCTVAQYIGEICRYLLNTPPSPYDTTHEVKIMFGNGLRSQIWGQFQSRFAIDKISEFYGATEGNANIINMDGKFGAVGFLSVLLPSFYPCTIIKIDEETGKPLRDGKGICIRCKPGEPGEFVGKIVRNDPVRDFHGYADKKATESKIVNDVWKKGDAAFLSGDMLVMDEKGYLYFRDRLGDTFRWRGENVSTTEVEGIVSQVIDIITDVAVYGVEVPGVEGKAGMAAILDPEDKVDMISLVQGVKKHLPSYAQPLFIRLVNKLDMTGTFKLKKMTLQKEGFDINLVKDKLYFLDQKQGSYVPITKEIYEKLQTGQMRL